MQVGRLGTSFLFIVGCNYRFTFDKLLFTSPGYPQYYPNNSTCAWKIIATKGWHINLKILDLNFESSKNCDFDSVTIYDGDDETAIPIRKMCGMQPPDLLRSISNTLTVVMKTDLTLNGKGFKMEYEAVPGKLFFCLL